MFQMPPYSPFLNPIEECWSKVKKNIRRNPLDKSDMLTPRIAEACKQVTVSSLLFFPLDSVVVLKPDRTLF
jgi:transposase